MSQIVVSNKNNKCFCIKVATKDGKQRKYRFRLKTKSKKKMTTAQYAIMSLLKKHAH